MSTARPWLCLYSSATVCMAPVRGGGYLLLPCPTDLKWEPQEGFLGSMGYHTIAPDSIACTYPWFLCPWIYPALSVSETSLFSAVGSRLVYRKRRWKLPSCHSHDISQSPVCSACLCFWIFLSRASPPKACPAFGHPANSAYSNRVWWKLYFLGTSQLMSARVSWCEWP